LGLRHDGKKEVIDFRLACGESAAEWGRFLADLYQRGLTGEGLDKICVDTRGASPPKAFSFFGSPARPPVRPVRRGTLRTLGRRFAHIPAVLRVAVEAAPMRADNIKVADIQNIVDSDDRVRRALRAGLLLRRELARSSRGRRKLARVRGNRSRRLLPRKQGTGSGEPGAAS
jgi:hypothetical protein